MTTKFERDLTSNKLTQTLVPILQVDELQQPLQSTISSQEVPKISPTTPTEGVCCVTQSETTNPKTILASSFQDSNLRDLHDVDKNSLNYYFKFLRCQKYVFEVQDIMHDGVLYKGVRVPMLSKHGVHCQMDRAPCPNCYFKCSDHAIWYEGQDSGEYCVRHRFNAAMETTVRKRLADAAVSIAHRGKKFVSADLNLKRLNRIDLIAYISAAFRGELEWYQEKLSMTHFPTYIVAKQFYWLLSEIIEKLHRKTEVCPMYLGTMLEGLDVSSVAARKILNRIIYHRNTNLSGINYLGSIQDTRMYFIMHGLVPNFSCSFYDYFNRSPALFDPIVISHDHCLISFRTLGKILYGQWKKWVIRKDIIAPIPGPCISYYAQESAEYQAVYNTMKINFKNHLINPVAENTSDLIMHIEMNQIARGGGRQGGKNTSSDPKRPVEGPAKPIPSESGRKAGTPSSTKVEDKAPKEKPKQSTKSDKKSNKKLVKYTYSEIDFMSTRPLTTDVSSKGNRCGYYVMALALRSTYKKYEHLTDEEAFSFFQDLYAFGGYGFVPESMIDASDVVLGLALAGIRSAVMVPVLVNGVACFEQVAGTTNQGQLYPNSGVSIPPVYILLHGPPDRGHFELLHSKIFFRKPTEYKPVMTKLAVFTSLPSLVGLFPKEDDKTLMQLIPPVRTTFRSVIFTQFMSDVIPELDRAYVFSHVLVGQNMEPVLPRCEFMSTDTFVPAAWKEDDIARAQSDLSRYTSCDINLIQQAVIQSIEDGSFSKHLFGLAQVSPKLEADIDAWLSASTPVPAPVVTAPAPAPVVADTPPAPTTPVAVPVTPEVQPVPTIPVAPAMTYVAPTNKPYVIKQRSQKTKDALAVVYTQWSNLTGGRGAVNVEGIQDPSSAHAWKLWRKVKFPSLAFEIEFFHLCSIMGYSRTMQLLEKVPKQYETKRELFVSTINRYLESTTHLTNTALIGYMIASCIQLSLSYSTFSVKMNFDIYNPCFDLKRISVTQRDLPFGKCQASEEDDVIYQDLPIFFAVPSLEASGNPIARGKCQFTKKRPFMNWDIDIPHFCVPQLSSKTTVFMTNIKEGRLISDLAAIRLFEDDCIQLVDYFDDDDVFEVATKGRNIDDIFLHESTIKDMNGHIYEVFDIAESVPVINWLSCFKYAKAYSWYEEPKYVRTEHISDADPRIISYLNDKNLKDGKIMKTKIHSLVVGPPKKAWWKPFHTVTKKMAKFVSPLCCVGGIASCFIPGGWIPISIGACGIASSACMCGSEVAMVIAEEHSSLSRYSRRVDAVEFDATTIENISSWVDMNGRHDEFAKIISAKVTTTIPYVNLPSDTNLCHGKEKNLLEGTRKFAVAHYWNRVLVNKSFVESSARAGVDSMKKNNYHFNEC